MIRASSFGRPWRVPVARALAMPARTRSEMSERSNSAMAEMTALMGDGSRVVSTIGVLWYAAHLSQRRTRPWVALAGLLVWPLLGTVVGAQDMHLLFFGQLVPTLVLTFTVARHGTGRYRWRRLAGSRLSKVPSSRSKSVISWKSLYTLANRM